MPGQSGTHSQVHANLQHTRLTRRAGHAIAAWHPTSGEWKALGKRAWRHVQHPSHTIQLELLFSLESGIQNLIQNN